MTTKEQKYKTVLQQIEALIQDETNTVGVLANVAAVLHEAMRFWWTGFYVERDGQLQLGPFQGPVACFTIAHGRGVCGTAYAEAKTIVVPNVHEFPGHIACSSASQSEIVVPIKDAYGTVLGVIDVDSERIGTFDATDAHYLEQLAAMLAPLLATA